MTANCKRCGQPFEPKKLFKSKLLQRMCDDCQYRNLMDNMDFPTPPEMLDPFTKIPTLTDDEYKRAIQNVKIT